MSSNAIISSLLAAGGIGIAAWTFSDWFEDRQSKKDIIKAITELRSTDLAVRQESSLKLTKFLEEKKGDENKEFVYDYNGVRNLLTVLGNIENQNEAVLTNSLIAVRLLCKDTEARREFIKRGGLSQLANILFKSQSLIVRQEASNALKAATRFDLKAREIPEDIPRGSEGSLVLTSIPQFPQLVSLLATNEAKIISGLSGAIANCSQTAAGALALGKQGSVKMLVELIKSPVKGVKNKALIAIANIFKNDMKTNFESATNPGVMKVALQNIIVDKEPLRIAILNYFEAVLLSATPEKKRDFGKMLTENPECFKYITLLALEGRYPETVRSASHIYRLLDALPAEIKSVLNKLHSKYTAEYHHKKKQQEALQQQQFAQLMMGGMGGMGGGMGGMDINALLGAMGGGGMSMDDMAHQMMMDDGMDE